MNPINTPSKSHNNRGGPCSIEFDNLTNDELERMEAMHNGATWVRVCNGRLQSSDAYKPLPPPADDPLVPDKWQTPKNNVRLKPNVVELVPHNQQRIYSPSIIVQHLVGYGWTRALYTHECQRFELWGFECLRSRRGSDGRFWEVWYLPFLSAAEYDLKRAIYSRCSKCGAHTDPMRQVLDDHDCPNAKENYDTVSGDGCGPGTMLRYDPLDYPTLTRVAIDYICKYARFGTLDVTVQRAAMTID